MSKGNIAVYAEYAGLKTVQALANAMPYRMAMAMARIAGRAAFGIVRYRRARTLARIRSVFPEKSGAEAKAIARDSIMNVFMTAVEMMRAPRLDRAWMDRHVADGELYRDRLKSLVDEGHGVVVMVPHSGNWYMAAWSMARYGLRLSALGVRQRNPKIAAWMERQYGDVEVLDRDERSSLVKIVKLLRSGGVFAILPDLRVWDEDVDCEFLGGHANVPRAGALCAVKCGSPIVVAQMRRENGKHVFNHIATLRPDPDAADHREEAARLTREAMRLIDAEVRKRPGEWFWYNKRWILEPIREEDRRKRQ